MFSNITKINLPKILIEILNDLKNIGARPILVGGCVRDSFLLKDIKDYDIEIFDLNDIETIQKTLEKYATIKLVGKSFGVLTCKIDDFDFDFSLPRVEKKIGKTHKDFEILSNANLSFKKASKRRDFTINSIGYDYFTNSFLDPYSGIKDLKNRKIRYINKKTFIEDSLRVYRAVQFSARFDFKLTKKTKKLCKKIIKSDELNFLPKQRVFEELKKLFLKSKKPSIGLKLLDEFKIFTISFKDSYKAVDNLAKDFQNKNIADFRKLYLFFAIFLKIIKEKEVLDCLKNITDDKKFINNILILCKNSTSLDEKKLKKLSLVLNLQDLFFLEKALNKKDILQIISLAKSLDIFDKPLKIEVLGKDLIALGFKESKEFKEILDFALKLQIESNLTKDKILPIIIIKFSLF